MDETFRGIVVYKSQLAFSVILCLPIFAQIKKTNLKFQNSSESTEPIWMDRQTAANIDQRTNDQVEMIWHVYNGIIVFSFNVIRVENGSRTPGKLGTLECS